MTSHPITVDPLQPYNGDDPIKRRKFEADLRTAENIATYLNRKMETDYKDHASAIFMFGKIAVALGLDETRVQNYLYKYSGSSNNAIEIQNPGATSES